MEEPAEGVFDDAGALRSPAHMRTAHPASEADAQPLGEEHAVAIAYEAGSEAAALEERPRGSAARFFLELLLILMAGIACFLLIRLFVGEAYRVPTGSMLQTIQLDDLVWGEKITYRLRSPRTGDVVTFADPKGSGQTLIKRVIAVEGQTINLVDGVVYVDGLALDEPYVNGQATHPLSPWSGYQGTISYPFTVPEGMVWVMGDNRASSADSRYFGPIERDSITSHALGIYWPPADVGLL